MDQGFGTDRAAEKARLRAHFEAARRAASEKERALGHAVLVARVQMLPEVRAARTVHVFWPLLARGEVDTRPLIAALHAEGRRVVLPVVLREASSTEVETSNKGLQASDEAPEASSGGSEASAVGAEPFRGGSEASGGELQDVARGLEASAENRPVSPAGLEASRRGLVGGAQRAGGLVHRLYEGEGALVSGPWGLREPSAQAPEVSPEEIDVVLVPALAADRQGHRLGYGAGFYDAFLALTPAFAVGLVPHGCLVDALPHEAHDVALGAVVTERETVRLADRLDTTPPQPLAP